MSPSSSIDSPYRDILHTNIVPPDEEIPHIRQLVVAPLQEIQHLTNEIAKIRDVVPQQRNELVRKRDGLTEFVESHLALVSMARKLPHDVVREIFAVSLPDTRHPTMNRTDAPVAISQICSDWRRIALSMPRLWTSLHIALPTANPNIETKAIIDGIKIWFARSGGLPLSISYVSGSDADGVHAEDRSWILQTLVQFSLRWRHMRFIFPSAESYQPLAALSPLDVPMLQTVVIHAGNSIVTTSDSFSFARGTRVHGISIRSRFNTPANINAFVPRSQIRHLSILGRTPIFTLDEAVRLFELSPQLETCALRIADSLRCRVTASDGISLQHMRRLCLVDETRANQTNFFSCIDLPSLEALEYSCEIGPPPSLSHLSAPHKLTTLGLSAPIGPQTLSDILRFFPMLQTLLLHQARKSLANNGAIVACALFALLTPSPEDPLSTTICPRLESLCCLGIDGGSDEELLALIETRHASAPHVHPLSRVHVVFARAPQLDITPELAAIGTGLTAILRYPMEKDLRFMARRVHYIYESAAPSPRVQEDWDADWVPSGTWAAEYAEWGVDNGME
ncbi:hypothetical protein B0H19DRAFT_1200937 [Mycena capillaripes]|nr:hypothetical protein B0H19DRAFT_1200937 [Mycena capillaripes]